MDLSGSSLDIFSIMEINEKVFPLPAPPSRIKFLSSLIASNTFSTSDSTVLSTIIIPPKCI